MAGNREFHEYIGLAWHDVLLDKLLKETEGVLSVSVENPDTEYDLNPKAERLRVTLDEQLVIRSIMRG